MARVSIRQGWQKGATKKYKRTNRPRNLPVFRPKVMASVGELKAVTTSITGACNCNLVTCNLINGCTQGDEIDQRIGREIRMRHITIRGFFRGVADATAKSTCNRVLIVYDKQPNHAAMTGADLFDGLATTPVDVTKMYNLDNRKRFTVLYDRLYPVDMMEYSKSAQKVPVYIDFPVNLPVIFNALGNATIASIETGSLYLVTMGDTIDAGDNESELICTARVRYEDK